MPRRGIPNKLVQIERYPLSFKSKCADRSYRHIVLAVFDTRTTLWGALGISRRTALQQKDVKFESLSALVAEYRKSYKSCSHDLHKAYVGLPLPHNVHSSEPIRWRVLKLSLKEANWADNSRSLDKYAKDARWIREYFVRTGKLPAEFGSGTSESPTGDGSATPPASQTPAMIATPRRQGREQASPAACVPETRQSSSARNNVLNAALAVARDGQGPSSVDHEVCSSDSESDAA